MPLFRKKPVVIEAVRYKAGETLPSGFTTGASPGTFLYQENGELHIVTLEGTMIAKIGDWIIKGVKGEYYPCKPDIFASTYERIDSIRQLME